MNTFRHATDLDRLSCDIVAAAELAHAPYDREVIRRGLQAYGSFFAGSPVSFRTSTKKGPERRLNVRYVELGVPHDPYATALAEGFIRHEGHPLDNLLPEIQATYPVVGYGVDLEVAYGLEKIWPFFPHLPQPAARAYAMPSLPDAVKAQAGYFEKYGLEDFSLFALDYRNRTINLYFMVRPGHLAPETIAGMIGDLGFQVPGQEILGYCSMAIPVYFTFSWDSPRVERLCFATVAFDERMLPTHLHPLIDRYCAGAPFAGPQRTFIFNLTFTRKGDFIKIENDYTGSMTDLMRVFS